MSFELGEINRLRERVEKLEKQVSALQSKKAEEKSPAETPPATD